MAFFFGTIRPQPGRSSVMLLACTVCGHVFDWFNKAGCPMCNLRAAHRAWTEYRKGLCHG